MNLADITVQDRRYVVALAMLGGFASFKATRQAAGIRRIAQSDDSVFRLHRGGYVDVVGGHGPRLTRHGQFAARVWARQLAQQREATA